MANVTDLHVVNTMPGGIITNTPLNCQRAKEISNKGDLARCPICQMRVVFLGGVGWSPYARRGRTDKGNGQPAAPQPASPAHHTKPSSHSKGHCPPRRRSPVYTSHQLRRVHAGSPMGGGGLVLACADLDVAVAGSPRSRSLDGWYMVHQDVCARGRQLGGPSATVPPTAAQIWGGSRPPARSASTVPHRRPHQATVRSDAKI